MELVHKVLLVQVWQQVETPEGEADVPSQDDSTEDKTEKRIEKRIGKEIAKRRALEAQVAELQAQLTQKASQSEQPAQPAPAQPLPSNVPLAQIEDFQSLQTLRDQAKEAKRFAQEQLDRDDFEPVRVGDTVLGKGELKAILRNAEKTLDDDIPARAQFLTQKGEVIRKEIRDYAKSNGWTDQAESRPYRMRPL